MTKVSKQILGMLVAVLLTSTVNSSSQAGNVVSMDSGHKITVIHDMQSGCKGTIYWMSEKEICHKKVIVGGERASYKFTKEQLKGDIGILAVLEFLDVSLLDKVQIATGRLTATQSAEISLSSIMARSREGYANKGKVFAEIAKIKKQFS